MGLQGLSILNHIYIYIDFFHFFSFSCVNALPVNLGFVLQPLSGHLTLISQPRPIGDEAQDEAVNPRASDNRDESSEEVFGSCGKKKGGYSKGLWD